MHAGTRLRKGLLRNHGGGIDAGVIEERMMNSGKNDLVNGAEATAGNDFLSANSRHALAEGLYQQEFAVVARRKIRERSLGGRHPIARAIPEKDRFP